jgi:hypothetical protein
LICVRHGGARVRARFALTPIRWQNRRVHHEGRSMRLPTRSLLLLSLLAFAACTKASDARRDYLLARPHGWIDLTLHAPSNNTATASAAAGAKRSSPAGCRIEFSVNGEPLLDESGDLANADTAKNPLGYRVVAPAGDLNAELTITGCVQALRQALPVLLEKDHLARLEFDGRHVTVASTEAYMPVTLEAVRSDLAQLQAHGKDADERASMLTKLGVAGVLLNVAVLGAVLLRRSR